MGRSARPAGFTGTTPLNYQSDERFHASWQTGMRLLDCAHSVDGSYSFRWTRGHEGSADEIATADFVIDAIGRDSTLARRFNARHAVFDRLVGVAVPFDNPNAASHCCTLVETTPHRWWYSAPVGNARSVAMLMSDGDVVRPGRLNHAKRWRAALAAAHVTRDRMSAGEACSDPQIYCAISQRLIRHDLPRERWLAVDPISGSGAVRALRTAQAATTAVLAALRLDGDAIDNYEADRDRECTSYLFERSSYYELETRWSAETFWQRRLSAAQLRAQRAPRA